MSIIYFFFFFLKQKTYHRDNLFLRCHFFKIFWTPDVRKRFKISPVFFITPSTIFVFSQLQIKRVPQKGHSSLLTVLLKSWIVFKYQWLLVILIVLLSDCLAILKSFFFLYFLYFLSPFLFLIPFFFIPITFILHIYHSRSKPVKNCFFSTSSSYYFITISSAKRYQVPHPVFFLYPFRLWFLYVEF